MIAGLRSALILGWMRVLPARHNPVAYALVFLYPLFFAVALSAIGGNRFTHAVIMGLPVAYMFNNGIIALPQLIVDYKVRKLQDMFVASPVGSIAYMFGAAFSRLLFVMPVILAVCLAMIALGQYPVLAIGTLCIVLLCAWMTGCAIGFGLSTYWTDSMQIGAVANLLGMLTSVLPPVLYPLDVLPAGWSGWLLLIPSVSAAHLIRIAGGATELTGPIHLWAAWAAMLGWTGLCLLAVAYKSRWREP